MSQTSRRYRPTCERLEARLAPATLTVTNTADSGPGSLREAILSANDTALFPGLDIIAFDIPGPGPHTITPGNPAAGGLPIITDPVVIDGYTQPGASPNTNPLTLGPGAQGINAVLQIEISGVLAGDTNGLRINTGGCTIRGLVINRFDGTNFGSAIEIIQGSPGGNVIEGNFLGTDPTGMIARPNRRTGVGPAGDNNRIGGTTPAARNLIAGNGLAQIDTLFANGTVIEGNFIGTTATGLEVLTVVGLGGPGGIRIGNDKSGTVVGGTAPGAGNLIAGVSYGIQETGLDASDTVIQGNFIGTNRTGDAILAIAGTGIIVGGVNTVIGGTTPAARNVISGNFTGVVLSGTGIVFQGNFVGTDVSGTQALPNQNNGVEIAAHGIRVGGTAPGAGNLISGNRGAGIATGYNSSVIEGNLIGTQVDGVSPLGNALGGIRFGGIGGAGLGGSNHLVGGMTDSAANVIAHNGGDGVFVRSGGVPISGIAILRNSIFNNAGLGIDLASGEENAAGVTPNDPGDADTGNNNLQNYPVLTGTTATATETTITGTLNSTANSTFRLEFFASAAVDPSGNGEGQTFLGFVEVTTDGSGNASFTAVVDPLPPGQALITATATLLSDDDSNPATPLVPRETSEFSAVFNNPPTVSDIADQDTNEDTPTAAIPFTVGDLETSATSLAVTGTSSNQILVPDGNIVFGGSEASRTVTVTPTADQSGTAIITVTVSDGTHATSDTFLLTVMAVNDTPTISNIAGQETDEDTPTAAIPFTVGDMETAPTALAVTASSSNPALVPNGNLLVGGSGANRTLTVTPFAGRSGTATITLTVDDGQGGTSVATFELTVKAVNDAPSFTRGADQVVPAGSGPQAVPGWATGISAGPLDEAGQTLNFLTANDNNGLFTAQPAIAVNGTLTFTPAPGTSGTATVIVRLQDNGGGQDTSPPETFTIIVQPSPPPAPTPSSAQRPAQIPPPVQTVTARMITRRGRIFLTITNNATGQSFTLQLVPGSVSGGVLLLVGDVTGDRVEDVVTGLRRQRGPVKVFDGNTGQLLALIPAGLVRRSLQGALTLQLIDRSGDGVPEIVADSGRGAQRIMRVFDGSGRPLPV